MTFTDKQLQEFKRQLQELHKSLLQAEETGQAAEETVELDQARVGRLSRMDALQGQAMSKETGRRRRMLLRQVEEALVRLESGEYGECLECGGQIAAPRLSAFPASPYCIDCAEALERDA